MPSWSISPWFFSRAAKTCKEDPLSEDDEIFTAVDLEEGVTLFQYGGLEGLPSFDVDCLKVHMLLQLAGVKHETEVCKEDLMSPSGELPFIMSSNGRCLAGRELETFLLRQLGQETPEELLELVRKDVRALWMSVVWSEPSIYEHILKPLYAAPYCRPVRELLIWKRQRGLANGAQLTDASVAAFDAALQRLEALLGEHRKFFGGEGLGALDALLGPDLMLIPFFLPASHRLHHVFSQHHSLHDYALHLLEYFRLESEAVLL